MAAAHALASRPLAGSHWEETRLRSSRGPAGPLNRGIGRSQCSFSEPTEQKAWLATRLASDCLQDAPLKAMSGIGHTSSKPQRLFPFEPVLLSMCTLSGQVRHLGAGTATDGRTAVTCWPIPCGSSSCSFSAGVLSNTDHRSMCEGTGRGGMGMAQTDHADRRTEQPPTAESRSTTCRVGWSKATVAGSWMPRRACTRARSSTAPSESRPACSAQSRDQFA